jgi:hypothetical protein
VKKYLLLILFVVSLAAEAQIQSWPAAGNTPSPLTFQLPSGRYVPSTKRYNLVWADQFFGLPQNKIQFVAQNYVATQKIFSYQATDYRNYNPDFLVISYHLANGLNPLHNDDAPLPHTQTGSGCIGVVAPAGYVCEADNYFFPWLSSHSISTGSAQYEQMFQHYDIVDSLNRVWHSDPFWHMNLTNSDWQNYMGDACIDWMIGNQDEGCFFDVSVETMVSPLYNPNAGDPVPHNFNWYISPNGPAGYTINTLGDFASWMNNQYLNYYQYLHQHFHTGAVDYLILPNTDQMVTGWYDPVWTDGNISGETIDGAMMESFGNSTDSDMFLTLERGLRHITGRGKILIAQFYNTSQPERYRRAGMYMLIKNENSFINIADGTVNWFPEYEIDLGDQSSIPANINSLRVAGSGSASLFKRDYANGMILCNTSTGTLSYTLTGNNWVMVSTSGGGSVDANGNIVSQSISYTQVSGSVTVSASDCIILKNMTGTEVNENTTGRRINIYSNPAHNTFTISLNNPLSTANCQLSIYDVTGRVVHEQKIHCQLSTVNCQLSSGVYFVKVSDREKVYEQKMVVE